MGPAPPQDLPADLEVPNIFFYSGQDDELFVVKSFWLTLRKLNTGPDGRSRCVSGPLVKAPQPVHQGPRNLGGLSPE